MDSIIAGIIILFLILFAILTLSGAFVEAQEALATTWEASGNVMIEDLGTHLSLVSSRFASSTSTAFFVFRNEGSTSFSDFTHWDVIVNYYGEPVPDPITLTPMPFVRSGWLPYRAGAPNPNEWSVSGIFADESQGEAEVYERNILNPGEEIRIAILVDPVLGVGKMMQMTLATDTGTTTAAILTRNQPPVADTAATLTLALPSRASADITATMLAVTDANDPAGDLVYTVTTAPLQGALNLGDTFTQADINAGLLTYTHTGTGDDSFIVSVSDGDDTLSPIAFTITAANAVPVLATNAGLTVNALTTGSISAGHLRVNDVDNGASELVYTVSTAPSQGSLSRGGSFTQADIDAGLLSYTHTGISSDTFSFNVSDGTNTIGLIWFTISVIPLPMPTP